MFEIHRTVYAKVLRWEEQDESEEKEEASVRGM